MKKVFLISSILLSFSYAQKDNVIETKVSNQNSAKSISIIDQEIRAGQIYSMHTFSTEMAVDEVAINLDRNFSEYLVQTLDREEMERSRFEN